MKVWYHDVKTLYHLYLVSAIYTAHQLNLQWSALPPWSDLPPYDPTADRRPDTFLVVLL